MKKTYIQFLTITIAVILLTCCSSVKKIVNKEFKPLSVKEQQIRAINKCSQNLDSLNPNIGFRIGKEILDSLLPIEIEKMAFELNDSKIVIHSFNPSICLTKQSIILDTDFSASFLDIQSKIDGKLLGYVSIATLQDTLFFLPALKTLKITNLTYMDRKPKLKNKAIATLIKPIAKHFLDNLNGLFFKKEPSICTGWGGVIDINTEDIFSNNETIVNGPIVDLSRFIKTTSWIIDKQGISVLLELEKTKSQNCSDSILNVGLTSDNVDVIYKAYQNSFNTKWLFNFQPFTDSARISLGITKATLASIFNDVLSTSTLDIYHEIIIPKESSKVDLEIDPLRLDCNSVREEFSFPNFRYDHNCDYSCMKTIKVRLGRLKISKRIDDPICAAARATCKLKRETERIAWKTSRESARIAHQIYNEGKVSACKLAVEASKLVDMGKIETSCEGKGEVRLKLDNLVLSNDLLSLRFNISGDANLDLNSFLGLYPQDVGYLLMCYSDYENHIKTNLKGDILTQFSEIDFETIMQGEDIVLTGFVSPIGYKAEADLSPLYELLLDPELEIKCPLLYSTLLAGGVVCGTAAILGMIDNPVLQLLLKGSAIGSYELDPFTQKLSPITFRFNKGNELKSKISWNLNSIEFTY
jgi:hypothetical protein